MTLGSEIEPNPNPSTGRITWVLICRSFLSFTVILCYLQVCLSLYLSSAVQQSRAGLRGGGSQPAVNHTDSAANGRLPEHMKQIWASHWPRNRPMGSCSPHPNETKETERIGPHRESRFVPNVLCSPALCNCYC